ncbi:MAG: F0F1 ATP synthase subunit A [Treponema sp.]|nr:F0F1 ATP synthase subunit A [Treponema sp.]
MDIGERLVKALEFETVFTIRFAGLEIPVTETVVITWVVMAVLVAVSILVTRNLKTIPSGVQSLFEAGIEFLESFSKQYFGRRAGLYGPYIGTVFLFLLAANVVPALTPAAAGFGGRVFEPLFEIKPPARDINFTAALAVMSILIVLAGGLKARGLKGWFKNLLHPVPIMLPFNILDYVIRPSSLCLRLFGNMLGGFIIMQLIGAVVPVFLPPVFSLYFDFFDGLIQALVFSFLTTLFLSEAVETG